MNIQYAKTILYAYPQLKKVIRKINQAIEKKALESSEDFRSAIVICDELVTLKCEKGLLFDLGVTTATILAKFDPKLLDHIRYRYFHIKTTKTVIDAYSRNAYRTMDKATRVFAEALDKAGITDESFEALLEISDYMSAMLDAVVQRDNRVKEGQKKRFATVAANKG